MENYAKKIPQDRTGTPMQTWPVPFPALISTTVENNSASSVTSLNPNTTVIEISAVTAPVALKWSSATVTTSVITAFGTSNFDNIIQAGVTRQFVVPRNTAAIAPGSVVGLNVQEGLYTGVALKTAGTVGSILLTQY